MVILIDPGYEYRMSPAPAPSGGVGILSELSASIEDSLWLLDIDDPNVMMENQLFYPKDYEPEAKLRKCVQGG